MTKQWFNLSGNKAGIATLPLLLVILVAVAVAVVFVLTKPRTGLELVGTETEDARTVQLMTQSDSTEVEDIQADLDETELEDLDSEFALIEKELE